MGTKKAAAVSATPEAKVLAFLEAHGLSQADFARACGVSREAISGWLRGKFAPGVHLAQRVATATKGVVTREEVLFDSAKRAARKAS